MPKKILKITGWVVGIAVAAIAVLIGVEFWRGTTPTNREAVDFSLTDTQGKMVRLRDFRGKVVVLDFWASWCPPCLEMIPFLEDEYANKKGKGLVVLGINFGEKKKIVTDFMASHRIQYPVLLNDGTWESPLSKAYRIAGEGLPAIFVIDRDGKMVGKYQGVPFLRPSLVQRMLAHLTERLL